MAMLEAKNLELYYNSIHAIKDVSFHVEEGEVISLIGANGAGKSTILKALSGSLKPKSGTILFEGQDVNKTPTHKIVNLGMALVPEGRRIFSQMTVLENLEMGAFILKKRDLSEELDYVYKHFPRLAERKEQIAGTLSGGEQQMLAMGRALMSHPRLLMLDEPSMGLAPILVDEIFEIIKQLHESGTTILLVEQNAQKALSVATRGYVLETGRVILEGTGKELLNNDKVKKAYLGG